MASSSSLRAPRGRRAGSRACRRQTTCLCAASRPQAWDGVVGEAALRAVRSAGPEYGVFRLGEAAETAHSALVESVVHALADDLEADTLEVEYWPRQEHASMEAHRDADEDAAVERGVVRHPHTVVLLYLDVEEGLRAPTVVWGDGDSLAVVPFVPGRAVAFPGSLMHAVPRPACEWLGADDPDPDAEPLRHVLVLNLWADEAPAVGELEDDDFDEECEEGEFELEQPGENVLRAACCAPRSAWTPVTFRELQPEGGEATEFGLGMFGTEAPLVTRAALGRATLEAALLEPSQPVVLAVRCPQAQDLAAGCPSRAGERAERRDDA